MRSMNRRSTPGVKAGRVQKKNNWTTTPDYYNAEQPLPVVDRLRPGRGYRHVLHQKDIHRFIGLLPDWSELSIGLNGIVLSAGEDGTDGYHVRGVVHICAWEKELWTVASRRYYDEHKDIFDRLEVPCEQEGDEFLCKWTEPKVRAYQLLHILLHELGHHHDRITTRSKVDTGRGEPYAEAYARRYEELIWTRYLETFELFY
jgi:hypothetical protein